MQEFLTQSSNRTFNVLVAEEAGQVIGGSAFSYVPKPNCGFSEYLVVEPHARGSGLGRKLFDRRKRILDGLAARHGFAACRGVFIEVDNPERTPPEMLEADRESSIDAHERLRIFGHLGFRRVDIEYVQPPLGAGKEAVEYLDLLFASWQSEMSVIPVQWILDTVEPVWRSWTPATAVQYLQEFRDRIGSSRLVSLKPLSTGAAE
jgi:GNAT superfamily N-acetyltransferase